MTGCGKPNWSVLEPVEGQGIAELRRLLHDGQQAGEQPHALAEQHAEGARHLVLHQPHGRGRHLLEAAKLAELRGQPRGGGK